MAAYAAAGLKDIITGLLPGGHSYYSEGGTGRFAGNEANGNEPAEEADEHSYRDS